MKIGMVGSGFIGKSYANNFIKRGYDVVQYSLEKQFKKNKDKIKDCPITFIAVPTPSTPDGFDCSIIDEVLDLIGDGNIAVIKSTILPGITDKLQKKYANIHIIHSPEFLTEATCQYDADYPQRNIIGLSYRATKEIGEKVLSVLPHAEFDMICSSTEAEFIKYGGNNWFYMKVLFMNTLFDLCKEMKVDFKKVQTGMKHDPRIGGSHLQVEHQGGRGAGGHCFIKDFAAYKKFYKDKMSPPDSEEEISYKNSINTAFPFYFLKASEDYNKHLLKSTGKDLDLLKGVYGDE